MPPAGDRTPTGGVLNIMRQSGLRVSIGGTKIRLAIRITAGHRQKQGPKRDSSNFAAVIKSTVHSVQM